ncbi:hypothetical protein OS493_026185 [Desmophyllum pertusum]|uniref:Uncharacterized protein n=1 Tax=Desmophyllum pertusum TaxID=174260 RepID=A0A9W9ZZN8_9CNID|nr:hypothetical protein OS493_026185 [Desmophyllum pertusum]
MVRASSFVLLVCLFFLVASKRGHGFPAKLQANDFEDDKGDLNQKERDHIRQILLQAAKEIEDQDVIKILKKSLILRLKICFSSPLPTGAPLIGVLPAGDKRDEELTPEQKHGLRTLLKEALEHIDEEEILNFLKTSLYFRLKFCLHTPFVTGPYPEPVPSTGGAPTSKPGTSMGPSITFKPPTTTSEAQIPTSSRPTTNQSAVNSSLSTAGPEALENVIASISRRDDIPAAAPVHDLPRDELTRGDHDDSLVPINGIEDPAVQQAELEGLDKQLALSDRDQTDDNDMAKLSESVVADKETTLIDEPDEELDVSIDDTSDAVGKATLHEEEKQSVDEMMTADSDEGEFSSVIRIDYDDLQYDEEKTGAGGGDLGPVIEPQEELSLY